MGLTDESERALSPATPQVESSLTHHSGGETGHLKRPEFNAPRPETDLLAQDREVER